MPPKPSRRDRKARGAPKRPAPRVRATARPPRPAEGAVVAGEPVAVPEASGGLRVVRRQAAAARPRSAAITRDYGYVRGELLRIGVLAGGIFAAIGVLTLFWD